MSDLLSICIPTFNRVHLLKQNMPALLSEAQLLGVKVFISDNHSADGTSDYLKTLSEQFSCLKYKIQKQNTGIDYNMISVMTMAEMRYVYLLGDDEVLLPNSLSKINKFLKSSNQEIDFIVLNGWFVDQNNTYIREHLKYFVQPSNIFEAISMYFDSSPHDLQMLPSVSSFIININCLNSFYLKYIGTSHAYAGMIWEYLLKRYIENKSLNTACLMEKLVLFPQIEKSWYEYKPSIYLYEIPLWYQTLPDEYQFAVANILKEYYQKQFNVGKLIEYRLSNQLSNDLLDKIQSVVPELEYKRVHFIANMPLNSLMLIVNFINTLQYDVQKKGHYDPNSIGDILVGVLDNIILSSNTETGE